MGNLISMDKKYKTREGKDARLLCVDSGHLEFPVVAIVEGLLETYTSCGKVFVGQDNNLDLIEIPQEHSVWIEVFKSHGDILSCSYESENSMRNSINDSFESNNKEGYQLIATKKVVVAEGEFCS